MYHVIVRRRTARMFELLTEDSQRLADSLPEEVEHVFPGDHPLGGERHGRKAAARWFERLDHLFPGHSFQVHRVVSRGWPWSTWIAVEWTAELRPQVGESYLNHGAHWLHVRWGKVRAIREYVDTQRVAEACAAMAGAGVTEASAPPIAD